MSFWGTKRWHHGKCVGTEVRGAIPVRWQQCPQQCWPQLGSWFLCASYPPNERQHLLRLVVGLLHFLAPVHECPTTMPQGHSSRSPYTFQDVGRRKRVERGLGALMFDGNKFEYCHCTLPQDVWEQLNPRGDHNIGSQEMLAAVMGLQTWKDKFAGHCLSFFGATLVWWVR